MDSLTEGTGIIVKMDGGDRFEGKFLSSDAQSISIRTFDEEERDLPKSGVKKIETIEKSGHNRIWDGALIGGAIGAATMALVTAGFGGDRNTMGGPVLLGAGIGAGIGLGLDAAEGARETLYVAP